MKEHPNLTIIKAFFKAYGQSDMNGIRKVMADNIKWHIPGNHPLSGTKEGIDEVVSYFEKLKMASFKAESIIMGVNDEYVIDCHKNWSNMEGVNNLTNMSCLLWRIEDQKIVEVFNFPENQNRVDKFFINCYGTS